MIKSNTIYIISNYINKDIIEIINKNTPCLNECGKMEKYVANYNNLISDINNRIIADKNEPFDIIKYENNESYMCGFVLDSYANIVNILTNTVELHNTNLKNLMDNYYRSIDHINTRLSLKLERKDEYEGTFYQKVDYSYTTLIDALINMILEQHTILEKIVPLGNTSDKKKELVGKINYSEMINKAKIAVKNISESQNTKLHKMSIDYEELKYDYSELEKMYKNSKMEQVDLYTLINDKNDNISKLQQQLKEEIKKKTEANLKITELNNEIENLKNKNKEINDIHQTHMKVTDGFGNQIKLLNNEIISKDTEIYTLNTRCEELKNENDKLLTESNTSRVKIDELSKKNSEYVKDISMKKDKLNNISYQLMIIGYFLWYLDGLSMKDIKDITLEIEQITKENDMEYPENVDDLLKYYKGIAEKISTGDGIRRIFYNAITKIRDSYLGIIGRDYIKKNDLKGTETYTKIQLEKKLSEQKSAIKKLDTEIAEANRKIKEFKRENKELTTKSDIPILELKNIKTELQTANEENSKIKKENNELVNRLTELTTKLESTNTLKLELGINKEKLQIMDKEKSEIKHENTRLKFCYFILIIHLLKVKVDDISDILALGIDPQGNMDDIDVLIDDLLQKIIGVIYGNYDIQDKYISILLTIFGYKKPVNSGWVVYYYNFKYVNGKKNITWANYRLDYIDDTFELINNYFGKLGYFKNNK